MNRSPQSSWSEVLTTRGALLAHRRCRLQADSWPPGGGLGESALFYGHLVGKVARQVDGRSLGAVLGEEVRYTVVAPRVKRTPSMCRMGCQSLRVPSTAGQGRGER